VIALTDHDDIRGAFSFASSRRNARARWPSSRGRSATRSGHLLALWIEEEIPMFCPSSPRCPDSRGRRRRDRAPPALVPDVLHRRGALRQLAALGDGARMSTAIRAPESLVAGRVRASRAAWLNTHVLRLAETGSKRRAPRGARPDVLDRLPGSSRGAPSRAAGTRDHGGRARLDAPRAPR